MLRGNRPIAIFPAEWIQVNPVAYHSRDPPSFTFFDFRPPTSAHLRQPPALMRLAVLTSVPLLTVTIVPVLLKVHLGQLEKGPGGVGEEAVLAVDRGQFDVRGCLREGDHLD